MLTNRLVIYGNIHKKESWPNMGKVSNDGQNPLPEFQKFLPERKLVPKICPILLNEQTGFSPLNELAVSYEHLELNQ
jgi:hypothetical protein